MKSHSWVEYDERDPPALAARAGHIGCAHKFEVFHAPQGAYCNMVEGSELLQTDYVHTKVAQLENEVVSFEEVACVPSADAYTVYATVIE